MYNKCQLIGNLGKDPEIRSLDGGKKVGSFSLATSESYKDKNGEKQTKTQWHNIVVWEKLAEICEKYLKKGSKVFIEGKITYRQYEDKEGVKKYITDIVCHELKMLDLAGGEKKENPADKKQEKEENLWEPEGQNADDDLPF